MANARIIEQRNLFLDFVVQKEKSTTKINDSSISVRLINSQHSSKNIESKDYPNTRVLDIKRNVLIQEQLPFRVKFLNKGFSAYGPENPPPIGIAVVGFNNYIL